MGELSHGLKGLSLEDNEEDNEELNPVCHELSIRLGKAAKEERWAGAVEALGSVKLREWCESILGEEDEVAFVEKWNKMLGENPRNSPKPRAEDGRKEQEKKKNLEHLLDYVCACVDVEKWKENIDLVVLSDEKRTTLSESYINGMDPSSVFKKLTTEVDISRVHGLVIWAGTRAQLLSLAIPEKWSSSLEELGLLAIGTDTHLIEVLKRTIPKAETMVNELAIEECRLEYVETTPERQVWQSAFGQGNNDKMQVKVVAGESGAGKTVFSTLAPKGHILYAKPSAAPSRPSGTASPVPHDIEEIGCLGEFHEKVSRLLNHEVVDGKCRTVLSATNTMINFHRNDSAWQKADEAWLEALKHGARQFDKAPSTVYQTTAESWWKGKGAICLTNLTLVMDEASELDFGRAMVDIGRYICRSCESRQLAEHVDLVIVGTGLERVAWQGVPGRRYGTDPQKYYLIKLGMPLLDKVLDKANNKEALEAALVEGVFSKILKANSRMLFRAVLPLLKHPIHPVGMAGMTYSLSDKLAKIGSFDGLMDYAVRVYLGQNSVGCLEPKEQLARLRAAFYYHLRSSQEKLPVKQDWWFLMPEIPELENLREHIFDVGLARSDGGTSPALKFLACCGRSNMLEISDGTSFEMLLANHLTRFVQVRDDIRCQMHGKLVSAWPPPLRSEADVKLVATEDGLKMVVDLRMGQQSTEKALCARIKKMARAGGDFALVFLQGGSNAQGPDVFLLQVERSNGTLCGKLHCFQCKNWKKAGFVSAKGWSSLGVEKQLPKPTEKQKAPKPTEKQKAPKQSKLKKKQKATKRSKLKMTPTTGSAAYSLTGIKLLASCIKQHSKLEKVELGQRVFVYSKSALKSSSLIFTNGCKVICKELLEPTISCWEHDKKTPDENENEEDVSDCKEDVDNEDDPEEHEQHEEDDDEEDEEEWDEYEDEEDEEDHDHQTARRVTRSMSWRV